MPALPQHYSPVGNSSPSSLRSFALGEATFRVQLRHTLVL